MIFSYGSIAQSLRNGKSFKLLFESTKRDNSERSYLLLCKKVAKNLLRAKLFGKKSKEEGGTKRWDKDLVWNDTCYFI